MITNDTNTTTLHYACRGSHGQTTVKVATPRSFNLETQGIINGAPFEDEYEARLIGSCNGRKIPLIVSLNVRLHLEGRRGAAFRDGRLSS